MTVNYSVLHLPANVLNLDPQNIYLFKINKENNRPVGKIFSKLTLKTSERRLYYRSDIFFVNSEQISHIVLVIMMNIFSGKYDRRKGYSLIFSREHCQRSSPLQISNMPWVVFEPAQNLYSGFLKWSFTVTLNNLIPAVQVDIIAYIYCWFDLFIYVSPRDKWLSNISYKVIKLTCWMLLCISSRP